jgi:hypothetical protein
MPEHILEKAKVQDYTGEDEKKIDLQDERGDPF